MILSLVLRLKNFYFEKYQIVLIWLMNEIHGHEKVLKVNCLFWIINWF